MTTLPSSWTTRWLSGLLLVALFQTSAVDLNWVPSQWIRLLIVAGFAGLLALVIRRRLLAALPLLLYLPIPPLYNGYMLQQARERYFVGLSAVLLILIAWLGAELWRRRPRRMPASPTRATGAGWICISLNSSTRL